MSALSNSKLFFDGETPIILGNLNTAEAPFVLFNLDGTHRDRYDSFVTPVDLYGVVTDADRLDFLAYQGELRIHRYSRESGEEQLYSLSDEAAGILLDAELFSCGAGLVCAVYATLRTLLDADEVQLRLSLSTLSPEGELTRSLLYEEQIPTAEVTPFVEGFQLQLLGEGEQRDVQIPLASLSDRGAGFLRQRISLPYAPIVSSHRVDQLRPLGFDGDLDEDGLSDELDPCPLVAGESCLCEDLPPDPEPGEDTTPLPAPGDTLRLEGSLDPSDPTWLRLDENCAEEGREVESYYDSYLIENQSGRDLTVNIVASWGAGNDGYLHLLRAPFDSAGPHDCIDGNDDGPAGVSESIISRVVVESGEQVVIVASTFTAGATVDAYQVTVTSAP